MTGQGLGQGATGCPIEQFDGVNDRDGRPRADLSHAADIPRRYHLRLGALDVADLALAQLRRDLRLDEVVDTGRAAAQVAFRHLSDLEPRPGQQRTRWGLDLLA